MLRLVAVRIAHALLTLLAISAIVFAGTSLLPGDVASAMLGQAATPEALAALRATLHLDQPAIMRYFGWLAGLLTGDLGASLVSHLPVAQLIGGRLANSLLLAGLTAAIAVPVSLALGMAAAIWQGSTFDRATTMGTIAAVSVPDFLVATIAVILFSVELRWLPAVFVDSGGPLLSRAAGFVLPVLTLALAVVAQMTRMTRAALIGVLQSSYIEMARLKGLRPARIVLRPRTAERGRPDRERGGAQACPRCWAA